MAYDIDYEFSITEEGGVEAGKQFAYYPGDIEKSGKSGLTIGHGVDLSHFTAEELRDAGVLEKDIKQVSDYLAYYPQGSNKIQPGPKGGQLTTRNTPLDILTRDEKGDRTGFKIEWDDFSVDNINKYMEERFAESTKNTYERLSRREFKDLSRAQRTVLFDLTYNAGENFIEGETIKLKQYIADNDWDKIEKELSTGQWAAKDKSRHKKRAALLKRERLDIDREYMMPNEAIMDNLRIPQ